MSVTNDIEFVEENFELMESELRFYETRRCRKYKWEGQTFTVFFYGADCRGPRPESYYEDVKIAEDFFQSHEEKEAFYLHLMV